MTIETISQVPPHSLDRALNWLRSGGRLIVRTYTQTIVIDGRTLKKFEAVGAWLLKEEGDGYRLRMSGKRSIYLFPGQLEATA